MDDPHDRKRVVTLRECATKFIQQIDKNTFDYTMPRVETLEIPEMKRPSLRFRIRNFFSLPTVSLIVGVIAGIIGIYISIIKIRTGHIS